MKICILQDCPKKVHARGLCNPHYVAAKKDGTFDEVALPSTRRHELFDKDVENRMATCGACGPNTRIVLRPTRNEWRCAVRSAEHSSNWKSKNPMRGSNRSYPSIAGGIGPRRTEVIPIREKFMKEQNGLCAICAQPSDETLALDHCHTTGEFRGLLCRRCNTGIGLLRDDKEILQKAINYLG